MVSVGQVAAQRADTLHHQRLITVDVPFKGALAITTSGPFLVVADYRTSPHFAVLSRSSGALVSRFGDQGKPAAFIEPEDLQPRAHRANALSTYDSRLHRYTALVLDSGGRLSAEESVDFTSADSVLTAAHGPHALHQMLTSVLRTSDGFAASGLLIGEDLVLLTPDGAVRSVPSSARRLGTPRATNDSLAALMTSATTLAADPVGQRIAIAHRFEDDLALYDGDGRLRARVRGPPAAVRFRVRDHPSRVQLDTSTRITYLTAAATPRFVYALWCGCRMIDRPGPADLRVYDWNGHLIERIVLDMPIARFTVTPDDAFLYAVVDGDHAGTVGEWRLPGTGEHRAY
jgi:hypothetical protein